MKIEGYDLTGDYALVAYEAENLNQGPIYIYLGTPPGLPKRSIQENRGKVARSIRIADNATVLLDIDKAGKLVGIELL